MALVCMLALAGSLQAHPSVHERIEQLSAAIAAQPDEPASYIRRGQEHSDAGHYAEALADFEKAAQLGDPLRVSFAMGVLRFRMGDLAAARQNLDAWLGRHPGHAPALEARAQVAAAAGDPIAALADYRASLENQRRPSPGTYLAAAKLLVDLEGHGAPQALEMLDAGMARLGTIPQLQRQAIALERGRGNLEGAIARHETLKSTLGHSPDWKVDMGELLLVRGRPNEALALFDAAAEQLEKSKATAARATLQARLVELRATARAGANQAAQAR